MPHTELQAAIEAAFESRASITPHNAPAGARTAVETALGLLDAGTLRVAEKLGGAWRVNEWLKKAVLLSFRIADNAAIRAGALNFYDKVPLKYEGWDAARFGAAGVRVVPPATVRRGAFVAPNVVLMPRYVNIGAYVDSGTMVDTWATVGSCAQIGKNCHISGGAGIGGVLEPLQAGPVIIEDNCFIAARDSGRVGQGGVPPYSVVVPGTMPGKPMKDGAAGPGLYCAVIVKRVDE